MNRLADVLVLTVLYLRMDAKGYSQKVFSLFPTFSLFRTFLEKILPIREKGRKSSLALKLRRAFRRANSVYLGDFV